MSSYLKPGLGELLRHLAELVDRGAQSLYRDKGLSYRPRYTPVMRALADGECRIQDITNRLAITQGAVSQTVKLMLEDGLVTRASGSDGRQSIIGLTPQGRLLLQALTAHWEAVFRAVENLESEVGFPLRTALQCAIAALEHRNFAERILASRDINSEAGKESGLDVDITQQGYFQDGGSDYAQYRPTYPLELIDALADQSPARQLVVDVGCGTGQLSVLLAERFGQVIATDVSEVQLANAIAHPKVIYRHEAAEAISVETGQADLIVAAQAAHWFDLPAFYQEVRRIAKAGAVVALISYGVPYLESPLNAQFQRFYWQELHRFWPSERHHVETGYTELPFPFETIGMPNFVIRCQWSLNSFVGYLRTWSASKKALAQGSRELLSGFESKLAELWGGSETKQVIVWPISLRAGRVPQQESRGAISR